MQWLTAGDGRQAAAQKEVEEDEETNTAKVAAEAPGKIWGEAGEPGSSGEVWPFQSGDLPPAY